MSARSQQSILLTSGLLSAVLWLLLTLISHGKVAPLAGFDPELPNDQMPTRVFLLIHFLLGGLAIAPFAVARGGRLKVPLWSILAFAVLFRLIALPSVPIHESDFNRYLWDGKVAVHGINPYRFAPSDRSHQKVADLRDENSGMHSRINHPDIPTIYPPVAQAVFALSSAVFGDSLLGLKAILLAFDLGILALVVALLRRLNLPVSLALLYAWHPLVIKEVANSAHYDVVPVFFTLLAIYLAVRTFDDRKADRSHLSFDAAISLAAGTLAKYFSVLLLPILFPLRRFASSLKPWLIFAAIVVAAFVPFVFWDDIGIKDLFSGLAIYQREWTFYPGAFTLLLALTQSLVVAKLASAAILATLVIRMSLTKTPDATCLARKCFIVVAALMVLTPTAYPWYFIWLLPLLCLFPSRAWLLLSWLLPLSYLSFRGDSAIADAWLLDIPAITWIIWGTFAIAWLIEKRVCQPLLSPPSSQ